MGWRCRPIAGKNNPSISGHSSHQTSWGLRWTKNSMERNSTLWSPRYREDFPCKGMCHRNERRNFFQHFSLRFNVKICRLIGKNFKSPFSIS
jgi:hypothetical protein